jgi:RNA polymerase sigma-70 factor (ECF subfamily)
MIETFNEHRGQLFGIAYRMLGSVSEADDMVQETWLRWQKQDAAEIRSAKSWLIATITRLCIDQLRSARRTREEYYGVWLPEPLVETPAPSPEEAAVRADSLTMAFMLMLETLSPTERAVFLLREVFDYDYADIASTVGKSEANCRQILRRAKAQFDVTPPASPPDDRARRVVERFMKASETGEVGELLALLTEDATIYSDGGGRVSAAGKPVRGAQQVSKFLVGIQPRLPADTVLRFVQINGRPGVLMSSGGELYNAACFDIEGERVRNIYIVRNPDKLRHVGVGS